MVAWVRDEPAAGKVEEHLQAAHEGTDPLLMSWINVAETFYILSKRNNAAVAEEFLERLPSLPIQVVLPDEEGIMAAARIKAGHAVAFGDAFAIALAQAREASVITGDPKIRSCGLVGVDWVGD
jgi:uncharacterized protein with PIN domain